MRVVGNALRAEMASAPSSFLARSADDHAWLGDVGERAIAVIRGRSVRVASPIEVAVVGASQQAGVPSVVAAFAPHRGRRRGWVER
jgi:hypothetical protein